MKELANAIEIGEICAALGHSYRAKIMQVLKENDGELLLMDLIRKCAKEPAFSRSYPVAKDHVIKMSIGGVVKLTKEEGKQYTVKLKKYVRVFIEDIGK